MEPLLPLQHCKKRASKVPNDPSNYYELQKKTIFFCIHITKNLLHSHLFFETEERGRPFCHSHSISVSRGKGKEVKTKREPIRPTWSSLSLCPLRAIYIFPLHPIQPSNFPKKGQIVKRKHRHRGTLFIYVGWVETHYTHTPEFDLYLPLFFEERQP